MKHLWLALAALLLPGCAARTSGENPLKESSSFSTMSMLGAGSVATAGRNDPRGARQIVPVVILLDVYHLTVPAGAVSRNDDFWKRVDEDRVDLGTHDLLLKNGFRIGIGRDTDWPYFKGLLGKYPSARSSRGRTQAGKEGYVELAMRNAVSEQVILGLDNHGNDWGRRFEKCDDVLGISFIASTHNPGEAIVKVCPIVRGLRRFYQTSIYNDETQFELVQPEHLYDMRIEARLPLGDFLVVGPSIDAWRPTSLGSTFLMSEGSAEPLEHVLVIVPRAFRTDDPTTQPGK
jgi:hypothetical protein